MTRDADPGRGGPAADSLLTIRAANDTTAEEVGQLADLLVAVVAEGASVGFLPPLASAVARGYWERALAPGVVLLLAEEKGRNVGTVQLRPAESANGRHRAEVAKLLVDPEHRRRGIGRALMGRLEEAARVDGRSLLVLDTCEGDPSNQLYRSLGYEEAGRIPRYARTGDGRLEGTVFYYKELV